MLLHRPPCRALSPWVSRVWAAHEPAGGAWVRWRERMVPGGGFHLVLRLDDTRIRIFDEVADAEGATFTAVVSGARSRFHVREATAGAYSVGLQIRPGAAGVILGVPAEALAERHTSLDDVWGSAAGTLRERLLETRSAAQQLELFEQTVLARLAPRLAAGVSPTAWAARATESIEHIPLVSFFQDEAARSA